MSVHAGRFRVQVCVWGLWFRGLSAGFDGVFGAGSSAKDFRT